MLAARDLSIVWADDPRYWRRISLPESRFTEVAELLNVCWLEVHGKINTSMLSTNTRYVSYLVYKCRSDTSGFEPQGVEVSIGINGVESQTQTVFLDYEALQRVERNALVGRKYNVASRLRSLNRAKKRQDGWLEVELGEYFCERAGKEGELKMSLMEVKSGNGKGGILIQGIEIRPKPY